MSKQPGRLSGTNSDPAGTWHSIGGRSFFWVNAAVLVGLAWFYMQHVFGSESFTALWMCGVIILAAALTVALERSLVYLPISLDWHYRLAFLGSLGVFLIIWLGNWIIEPATISPAWLVPVGFGAFLGGIIATSLNERLWENNSPPSAEVMDTVYQHHRQLIGSPGPTPLGKRLFDLLLASVGLLISIPIWLLSLFLLWIEDPGPLLFVKNSVGRGGKNFHQYKLRTMVRGAEDATGPVLASEKDERVLTTGYILRKTALDELPQLLNILRGEMSFVGPRPQRTVLVQGYLQDMPEYAHRHRVLPGLAGLAQVVGDYYLTPRQKLRFDRLYIEYSSLGFDLKLILLAFAIAFWYRWQKNWNGRLPRRLLRLGRP